MPSGTFHLNELDSDKITLDGTLSVSGASTLKGDVALSSNLTVAGDTALANTSAGNVDVDGTLSVSGITTIGGHILPSVNDAFDIGSPEFKIRDLYVSDNSLWIGDVTKISFSGGKMKFRKRKTDVVPAAILEAGREANHPNDQATLESALAHAGVSSVHDMQIFHWQRYMRDALNVAAEITDIFRDNDDDYEETSASDAWKEIDDTKIYTTTHVGIGTSDPEEALHIRGAIKVEDGFSLARNEGNNPSLIIDTANFGLDETVNDLTGMGNTKYTKLYRVYGTNSEGVGKNWYWGYADDNYTRFSLSFDGGVGGPPDPDIAFVFTTSSELHCNAVHAALAGNADTATRLQTPRTINGVAFDGSADITIPAGVDGITSVDGNIGIGGDSTDYDTRFQVHGGSSKFESGPYSRSQGKRYNYNFATQGNNNHTLTIPMTGSSYRGMMKLKINVIQVAANGSAANMAEIEGYISAYGGTHVITATRGARHEMLAAEHRCANGTTSSGDLKIFYRPNLGYLQDVNVNFDVELQLGASFAHAGSLSHEYAGTNYAIGPTDFNQTLYQLDGYKKIPSLVNMAANQWRTITSGNNELTSGTWIVSFYLHTAGYGGVLYDETYSGTFTWFSGSTNSTNVSNIALHNAGHADNNETILMRTRRTGHSQGTGLVLEIQSNYSWSRQVDFHFRRLI